MLSNNILSIILFLWIFFTAFCVLEALLPSLVSKIAPAGLKGTAMGLYTTNQFLGIFIGGVLAGWIYQYYKLVDILLCNVALLVIWFMIALWMKPLRYLSTCIFPLSRPNLNRDDYLSIPGVIDAAPCLDEGVVYLKIDKDICSVSELQSRLNFTKNTVSN